VRETETKNRTACPDEHGSGIVSSAGPDEEDDRKVRALPMEDAVRVRTGEGGAGRAIITNDQGG